MTPPSPDPVTTDKSTEVHTLSAPTPRSNINDDSGRGSCIHASQRMATTLGKRRTQTDNSSLEWRVRCVEESIECLLRTRTAHLLDNPTSPMQLTHITQNNTDHSQMLLSMSKLLEKLYNSISFIEARYKYLLPVPLEQSTRPKDDSRDK